MTLGFIVGMLVLFRATGYMSTADVILNIPIGVNEMVLAVWLIARGFNGLPPPRRRHQPS